MEKTPMDIRYDKLGPQVVKALQGRYFDAWYFNDCAQAVEQALSLIPPGSTVSWGGSMTVAGLGLQGMVVQRGYPVIDRDAAPTPEDRVERMRQALLCHTFLTGTNALSEDGQLVNIDGNGNRVAAMIYGPRQVIVLAGMNKVAKNLEAAMVRARTIAAPANVHRIAGAKTPCRETGSCADCRSPDSICTYLVTTRLSRPAGRIKVILIGKDLGL